MGGRGKSSANAPTFNIGGGPRNFADPGILTLEQLEAQDERRAKRFTDESPEDVAHAVELAVGGMLRSVGGPEYEARRAAMLERIGHAAAEMGSRPLAEREAFSERLAPLFARLREQAGEES